MTPPPETSASSSDRRASPVGFIGLGKMGARMAANLQAAGFPLVNRRSFLNHALAATAGVSFAPPPTLAATQEKYDVRNLRITDLRTFLVDAGNDENYVCVKIYTNHGITGLGEGTLAAKCLTVATAIGELKRHLVGKDPTEIERHWQDNSCQARRHLPERRLSSRRSTFGRPVSGDW